MPDLHALLRASLLTAVLSGMVAAPPALAGALPQTQEVSTGLWVQVGRFARPEAPAEIAAKLGALPKDQTAAWQLLVMPTKDPDVQRVLIGPFGAQADAQHARGLINDALKLDAAVLPLKGAAPEQSAAKTVAKGKAPLAAKTEPRKAAAREQGPTAKAAVKAPVHAPVKEPKVTRHAEAAAHLAALPKPMRSTPMGSHPGAAAMTPAPAPAAAVSPAPKPVATASATEPRGAAERVAAARAAKTEILPAPTGTPSPRHPHQVSGTVATATPPSAPATPAAVTSATKLAAPSAPATATLPKAPLRPTIPGASSAVAGVRNL